MEHGRQWGIPKFAAAISLCLLTAQLCTLWPDTGYRTVTAVRWTEEANVTVTGTVIREEQVLTAAPGSLSYRLKDGQRAAAGEIVADCYAAPTAWATADCSARQTCPQATASDGAYARHTAHLAAIAALDAAAQADQTACPTAAAALAALFAPGSDTRSSANSGVQADWSASEAAVPIRAPVSGVFSQTTDGLESVLTPALLPALSAEALDALAPAAPPQNAAGRLVTGGTWYFAASLPADADLPDTVQAELLSGCFRQVTLQVVRTQRENGTCFAVFSCAAALDAVASLRALTVRLVLGAASGLRLPKAALCQVGGQSGVYCLVGRAARFKPVEVLQADPDGTLVVALDLTSTQTLWPGDAVLLPDDTLYDGKVIKRS